MNFVSSHTKDRRPKDDLTCAVSNNPTRASQTTASLIYSCWWMWMARGNVASCLLVLMPQSIARHIDEQRQQQNFVHIITFSVARLHSSSLLTNGPMCEEREQLFRWMFDLCWWLPRDFSPGAARRFDFSKFGYFEERRMYVRIAWFLLLLFCVWAAWCRLWLALSSCSIIRHLSPPPLALAPSGRQAGARSFTTHLESIERATKPRSMSRTAFVERSNRTATEVKATPSARASPPKKNKKYAPRRRAFAYRQNVFSYRNGNGIDIEVEYMARSARENMRVFIARPRR